VSDGEALLALDLVAAARAVAVGDVDPVELTELYLERIDRIDQGIGAYLTVTAERALEQAHRARADVAAGRPLGPLHGVPVGVKDLFDTAGIRTTYGSALYRDHVPQRDATVVTRLRAAGAVVLGKHATHELAWGGTTTNPHFGPTRNPHDPTRIPGGSSGGSAAAVVSGTALAAVGTDTCGSVRIPAALSGCVGLKPTYGRVSLAGALPLARSLDHAGPITRTVADAALLLSVLAGADPLDLRTLDDPAPGPDLPALPPGLRVGRLRGWFEAGLDVAARAGLDAAAAALSDLGCTLVDLVPPEPGDVVAAVFRRVQAEAGALHAAAFAEHPHSFGPDVAENLAHPLPTPRELARSEAVLAGQVGWLLEALGRYDLLLAATLPVVAPPIGSRAVAAGDRDLPIEWALTRLTSIFDVAGLPALTLPTPGGPLPTGAQLVGRRLDEVTVLCVGHALEAALWPGGLGLPVAALEGARR
jgi:aspartyl-tRNA(Asn)/glutamyl-tRNA(Gln) amidotransferase subunit A